MLLLILEERPTCFSQGQYETGYSVAYRYYSKCDKRDISRVFQPLKLIYKLGKGSFLCGVSLYLLDLINFPHLTPLSSSVMRLAYISP